MSRPARDLIQPPVNLAAPIDHYPETIRGPHIEKVPELLNAARGPLASSRDLSAKLDDAARRVKDKAHLAREMAPLMERVSQQYDKAIATLTSARESKEREIDSILTPSTPDPAGAEIRNYFRERKEAFLELSALIRGGDRRTTAAVLSAPPFLSGITDEQQRILRQQARLQFAPEQHGLSEDIGRAIERVRAAGAAFVVRVGGELHKWGQAEREVAAIKQGIEANV